MVVVVLVSVVLMLVVGVSLLDPVVVEERRFTGDRERLYDETGDDRDTDEPW